jgi:hypothetical protein
MHRTPSTNWWAVSALTCALLGIATFVFAPAGAVLGHVAVARSGGRGTGMARAAITVGWLITAIYSTALIVTLTWAVLRGVALYHLLRALAG